MHYHQHHHQATSTPSSINAKQHHPQATSTLNNINTTTINTKQHHHQHHQATHINTIITTTITDNTAIITNTIITTTITINTNTIPKQHQHQARLSITKQHQHQAIPSPVSAYQGSQKHLHRSSKHFVCRFRLPGVFRLSAELKFTSPTGPKTQAIAIIEKATHQKSFREN
jgi:hypothetical protein